MQQPGSECKEKILEGKRYSSKHMSGEKAESPYCCCGESFVVWRDL